MFWFREPSNYPHEQISRRRRSAIVWGTAIPLGLFVVWNAVILGTITTADMDPAKLVDPLQQLRDSNEVVGVSLVAVYFFFLS